MKPVKLFDDYLQMAANANQMSREQYTATYLSEKSYGINQFSPMAYAQRVLDGELDLVDAAKESGLGVAGLITLIKKIDKKFKWSLKEGDDHEVGMAQGQLEAIINAAMDLQEKLGGEEKDIPGWIQDHISQSYNYLKQANDNYHELEEELNELNLNSVGMKEFIKKVSDQKDILQKLGFSKVKDLIGYLKDGSIEDWEEIRTEGAALGILIEEVEVNEKMKIIMRSILNKMIPAAFGASSNPKMRDEMRDAIQAAIEPILTKYEYVVESKESDALAKEIDKAMIKIDDSMSYEDFALAVGKILKDEYGSQNFGPFMKVLHKDLGI